MALHSTAKNSWRAWTLTGIWVGATNGDDVVDVRLVHLGVTQAPSTGSWTLEQVHAELLENEHGDGRVEVQRLHGVTDQQM
jgi:hypothetical protein